MNPTKKRIKKDNKKDSKKDKSSPAPSAAPSKTQFDITPSPTSSTFNTVVINAAVPANANVTTADIEEAFTQQTLKVLDLEEERRILSVADAVQNHHLRVLEVAAVVGDFQLLTVATIIDCDQLSIAPDGHSCYSVVQTFTTINGGENVDTEALANVTKTAVDDGDYAEEISAATNIDIVAELPQTAEPSRVPSDSPSASPSTAPSKSQSKSPSASQSESPSSSPSDSPTTSPSS